MAQYVEVELDKPRRLRFDLAALHDLQRRLGGATLLGISTRIAELDLEVVMQAYLVGLRWEDRALTPAQVMTLLQQRLDGGGQMSDLITPLSRAFVAGAGLVSANGAGGEAEPGKA